MGPPEGDADTAPDGRDPGGRDPGCRAPEGKVPDAATGMLTGGPFSFFRIECTCCCWW